MIFDIINVYTRCIYILHNNTMKKAQKLESQVKDLKKKQQQIDESLSINRQKQHQTKETLETTKKYISWLKWYKKLPSGIKNAKIDEMRDEMLYDPMKESVEDIEWELDIQGYIYKWSTPDDVVDFVEECEREIVDNATEEIYYANAMEYLRENDATLTESLEIAKNYWYDLGNLNSCVLASLHQQENGSYHTDFSNCIEALKDKAEEINEEREKLEQKTWLTIDEYIETEAEKFTKEAIETTRTKEELKEIESLQVQLEILRSIEIKLIWERRETKKQIEELQKQLESLQPNQ